MNTILAIFSFLMLQPQNGFRDYPPCDAYETVGKDTIQSAISYSNTFYTGIDNPLIIHSKLLEKEPNCISSDDGEAFEDEGSFIVIPSRQGTAVIRFYQCNGKDSTLIFEKEFEVKNLPTPRILLGDYYLSQLPYITKAQLSKESKMSITVTDDIIGNEKLFNIKDIVIGYSFGSLFVTKKNEGAKFSAEIIELLMKQPPGHEISFLIHVEGEGGVIKTLPMVKIKIY